MRTTVKDINIAFKRFCDVYNFEVTDWKNPKIGTYHLNTDYNYRIQKLESEGLSISCPFGNGGHKASEFINMLWFAINAKSELRNRNKRK